MSSGKPKLVAITSLSQQAQELKLVHDIDSALGAEGDHFGGVEVSVPCAQHVGPTLNGCEKDGIIVGVGANDLFGDKRLHDRRNTLQQVHMFLNIGFRQPVLRLQSGIHQRAFHFGQNITGEDQDVTGLRTD